MTDQSDAFAIQPARTGRRNFPDISSRAFEHPADRAALGALRKVPGFDVVLRKLIGFIGERGLRYLHLGSAVRVGPKQYARLHRIYLECAATLDMKDVPELYVAQTPFVNAGAIGVEKPFLVLNSGTVQLLNDEELRFVLGHELGHVLSDHVLYKTMLVLLINLGPRLVGVPLGGLAIFAIVHALQEWHRKSELSCDRAGLLCVQDEKLAFGTLFKMAGGSGDKENSVDEFVNQAHEYEEAGGAVDGVLKLLNVIGRTHPLNAVRVLELKRWALGGDYEKILRGDYPQRADDPTTTAYEQFAEGARAYQKSFADSKDPLIAFMRGLGNDVASTAANVWTDIKKNFS